MSELEYFPSVENIEISLSAQARQSLLLLTQGNIYNHLRFLNKYLMFLEELNELFRENWSKFLTARVTSFLKTVPGCRVYRHVLSITHIPTCHLPLPCWRKCGISKFTYDHDTKVVGIPPHHHHRAMRRFHIHTESVCSPRARRSFCLLEVQLVPRLSSY